MMRSWLVLGSLLFAGCSLYFGGDDQPPNCGYGDDVAVQDLRDPQTGDCEVIDNGGGYCSPDCPCPGVKNTPAIEPDWPSCYTQCDGLDEPSCLAEAGCHADYTGVPCPPGVDCLWSGVTYWQCSAVAPSGGVEGSGCWGLDAQTCQEQDDCASAYQIAVDGGSSHSFDACFPEPGAVDQCSAITCAPGSHCDVQCAPCDPKDPNTGCMQTCTATCVPDVTCATVDCAPGTTCEEICNGPICDPPGPCADQCAPQCVPTGGDPGECYGQVTCNSAPPACPASTTPGVANGCYTGYCIPISVCGKDAGSCYPDGGVMCSIAPPACPSGTEPGIANGCWTGYCIPDWACAPAPCASITDEKSCASRSDCTPIYDGMDCTCDPSGCTCKSETFARCE